MLLRIVEIHMKLLSTLVLTATLALAGCAGISIDNQTDGAIPNKVLEWGKTNVYRVNTSYGSGSAFFVSKDTAITACHVVRSEFNLNKSDPSRLIVLTNDTDTKLIVVDVVSCNEKTDVAVLKINEFSKDLPSEAQFTPVIPAHELERGDKLYGYGHPLGLPAMVADGHYQFVAEREDMKNVHMISLHTIPGDSGSPALALVDGEVVIVGVRISIRVMNLGWSSQLIPTFTMISGGTNVIYALHH
jgi:S1-C subfamily serine protease